MALCGDVNDADDLVHKTLLNAWENIDRFQENISFRGWLLMGLRNDYYSRPQRRTQDTTASRRGSVHQLDIHKARLSSELIRLADALFWLPEDEREALILVAEGVDCEEAAIICSCPVRTFKGRFARGRLRLARILDLPAFARIEESDCCPPSMCRAPHRP